MVEYECTGNDTASIEFLTADPVIPPIYFRDTVPCIVQSMGDLLEEAVTYGQYAAVVYYDTYDSLQPECDMFFNRTNANLTYYLGTLLRGSISTYYGDHCDFYVTSEPNATLGEYLPVSRNILNPYARIITDAPDIYDNFYSTHLVLPISANIEQLGCPLSPAQTSDITLIITYMFTDIISESILNLNETTYIPSYGSEYTCVPDNSSTVIGTPRWIMHTNDEADFLYSDSQCTSFVKQGRNGTTNVFNNTENWGCNALPTTCGTPNIAGVIVRESASEVPLFFYNDISNITCNCTKVADYKGNEESITKQNIVVENIVVSDVQCWKSRRRSIGETSIGFNLTYASSGLPKLETVTLIDKIVADANGARYSYQIGGIYYKLTLIADGNTTTVTIYPETTTVASANSQSDDDDSDWETAGIVLIVVLSVFVVGLVGYVGMRKCTGKSNYRIIDNSGF